MLQSCSRSMPDTFIEEQGLPVRVQATFTTLVFIACAAAATYALASPIAESAEQRSFILSALLLVPTALCSASLAARFPLPQSVNTAFVFALTAAGLAAIVLFYRNLVAETSGIPLATDRPSFPHIIVLVSAGVLAMATFKRPTVGSTWVVVGLAMLAAFCLFSCRIYAVSAIDDSWQMTSHLDAVLYSVSQVATGKSILVDLPAQYGLYGELLAPIFRVVGLSVLSFTTVMAILYSIAVGMVLYLLARLVKTDIMRLAGGLSLVSILGYSWAAPLDTYFQYYPIRFLLPALAAGLYLNYLTRPGTLKLVALGIVGGVALPWNLDSGVPVFGSLFAALLLSAILEKQGLKPLMVFCISSALTVLAFIATLYAKGNSPDWGEVVRYQTIFYINGQFMLPMSLRQGLWLLVLAALIAGIVSFAFKQRDVASKSILQISVLGIGLFAYFQGRSNIIVLMLCCWPALLVMFHLADRLLLATWDGRAGRELRLALVVPIALAVMLGGLLVYRLPAMAVRAQTTIGSIIRPVETALTRSIKFVRDNADPASVVIIAPHQAVYYAEAGLGSALTGPGLTENLRASDRKFLVDRLLAGQVKTLFFKPYEGYVEPDYDILLGGKLKVSKTSEDGMIFLQPAGVR